MSDASQSSDDLECAKQRIDTLIDNLNEVMDEVRAEFGKQPKEFDATQYSDCVQEICRKRELLLAIREIYDHYLSG
jgi:hypothetical protein